MSEFAAPRSAPPQLSVDLMVAKRAWVWGIVLFVLAIGPFLFALHGEYIWDDDQWLVNNAPVHAWNGLRAIWNPTFQALQYYPVTFTMLWVEHKIWGLDPAQKFLRMEPLAWYHLANMLLHGGGAVLLWLCLRKMGVRGAWVGALLWAVHPVQVESVAWISEIKNTLSGVLYFFAAWCYLDFDCIGADLSAAQRRRWTLYAVGLLAFIAAILSKSVVCTLPAALLIVVWWKSGRWSWKSCVPLVPWFLATAAIGAFASWQEHLGVVVGGGGDLHFSFAERWIICGKDFWFYLRTLIVPYPLMPIYPRWTYDASVWLNYVPMGCMAALMGGLFWLRKRIGKGPAAAALFFVATLSPALGFINFFTMRYTFVADHYQYLACAGIFALVAEGLARGCEGRRFRVLRRATTVILIAGFLALTAFYASLYQTQIKLWSWNVARNPEAFTAHNNLGIAYLNAGNQKAGVSEIEIALRQQPDDDNTQRTVCRLALAAGKYEEALAHIQRAIALRPRFGLNYKILGDVYEALGRRREALDAFATAANADLTDPIYFIAYAEALKREKKFDEAAKAYEAAVSLAPGNLITRYNYGNVLLDLGRPVEAIAQYQFILKYQPEEHNGPIWHNLAVAYDQSGQRAMALEAEQRGDEIDAANAAKFSGKGARGK